MLDGSNGMVVEHVTMALASATVVLLSETGVLDVPTAGVVTCSVLAPTWEVFGPCFAPAPTLCRPGRQVKTN